jgi:hypothetical protein
MGNYGIIRPADVSLDDIEVFLHFTPSRNEIGDTTLTKLNTNEVLIKMNNPNNPNNIEIFGGMYTLKLPTNLFGVKGFYSIMIKPIEIRTKIVDTGVLSSLTNIKGLVFDSSTIDPKFLSKFQNNGLIGYRIEYLNKTNVGDVKINNFFRIITSNNKAEPLNQNLTNTSQKAIRYRFNDNSTLVFVTVTPSSSSSVKPNVLPYIGEADQNVIITNTFFNPIMLEIEMVEHDIDTLAIGLFGNQTKSLEDGIYTQYNKNGEIYKQYNLFEIMDEFTGKPLFEVKQERDTIDFTKNLNEVVNI